MSSTKPMPRPPITKLEETERVILRWGERGYVISIPGVWLREHSLSVGDTILLRKRNGEVIMKLDKGSQG